MSLPKRQKSNDELFLRNELIKAIARVMRERDLTQEQAARRMGVDQPTVSGLLRRKRAFTSEHLMHFLLLLGCDIRISVERSLVRRRGDLILDIRDQFAKVRARRSP